MMNKTKKKAKGKSYSGKVTRVINGDTFMVSNRMKPIKIHNLKSYGRFTSMGESRYNRLKKIIQGRTVEINTRTHDIYGRNVSSVKLNNKLVKNLMSKKLSARPVNRVRSIGSINKLKNKLMRRRK